MVPHTQSHQVLAQPGATVTADEDVDIALKVFDERSRGIHPFDDGIGKSEKPWEYLVGVAGFEPATPSSRTRCATRLRYTPKPSPQSRPLALWSGSYNEAFAPSQACCGWFFGNFLTPSHTASIGLADAFDRHWRHHREIACARHDAGMPRARTRADRESEVRPGPPDFSERVAGRWSEDGEFLSACVWRAVAALP